MISLIDHDSRVRGNSEVVKIYSDIYVRMVQPPMARHCFLTILTSGKPEVPNDATIISIKDEQLLNTGL